MEHTGFSPGDSGNSQAAQTSSGSCTLQEPPSKVRREVERLELRAGLAAAPALPADGPSAAADAESVRSRRSMASGSSSSSALRMQVLEAERDLKRTELEIFREKQAQASSQ